MIKGGPRSFPAGCAVSVEISGMMEGFSGGPNRLASRYAGGRVEGPLRSVDSEQGVVEVPYKESRILTQLPFIQIELCPCIVSHVSYINRMSKRHTWRGQDQWS
jgi:hypothetical protein